MIKESEKKMDTFSMSKQKAKKNFQSEKEKGLAIVFFFFFLRNQYPSRINNIIMGTTS